MKFTQTQIQILIDVLLALPDPRKKRGKRHMMISILALSIRTVLCGARGDAAITHQTAITLAQQQVDSKTNEIPTAKKLLSPMDLKGKVVTADAMHTQTDAVEIT